MGQTANAEVCNSHSSLEQIVQQQAAKVSHSSVKLWGALKYTIKGSE